LTNDELLGELRSSFLASKETRIPDYGPKVLPDVLIENSLPIMAGECSAVSSESLHSATQEARSFSSDFVTQIAGPDRTVMNNVLSQVTCDIHSSGRDVIPHRGGLEMGQSRG